TVSSVTVLTPPTQSRRRHRIEGGRMGRVGADADFRWRRIVVPAYGPSLLSAAAKGAVVPIAALRADALGAGIGTAALIVSLTQVGQLLGTLPAGWLVARIGGRATLARARPLDALAFVVSGWAPSRGSDGRR